MLSAAVDPRKCFSKQSAVKVEIICNKNRGTQIQGKRVCFQSNKGFGTRPTTVRAMRNKIGWEFWFSTSLEFDEKKGRRWYVGRISGQYL